MSEREATFTLRIDGDSSAAQTLFSAFTRQVKSNVSEIERAVNGIELFKNAKSDLEKAQQAVDATRASLTRLRDLEREVQSAGESIGTDLAKGIKEAERAVTSATKEFDRQQKAVDKLGTSLKAAGVDTTRLAQEQIRLGIAAKQAAAAEEQTQAARTLGIKLSSEARAEYERLRTALGTLKASGTATFDDIAKATAAFNAKAAELHGGFSSLTARFEAARAPLLALVAAFASVVEVGRRAFDAANELEKRLAQTGAQSSLTQKQVDALGDGLRELAQTAGFELARGFDAANQLLRAGLPIGDVLKQIELADTAAKASMTDLNAQIQLQIALFKGWGVSGDQMKSALDGLFVSMKNGGPSFTDLAAGIGSLGPAAKATGTTLAETSAIVENLTQAGLSGQEALAVTEKLLLGLADPAKRAGLRDLGIEGTNAIEVFRQLRERGLPITEILGLELASKKSAVALATVVSGADKLTASLQRFGEAKGTIDKVGESLNNIRAEALERLSASVQNLLTTLGQVASPSAKSIDQMGEIVKLLNNIGVAAERLGQSTWAKSFEGSARVVSLAIMPIERIKVLFELVADAAKKLNADVAKSAEESRNAALSVGDSEQQIANATAAGIAAATAKIDELRGKLKELIPDLQNASKILQGLGSDVLAGIDQQAALEIAALDKLTLSEKQHAEQTVAIQAKAAADKLAIMQISTADVLRAITAEAAARKLAAGNNAKELALIEEQTLQLRKDTLTKSVAQYQAFVLALTQLETQHFNNIKTLSDQRSDIELAMQEKLRGIYQGGLTDYERFNQTLRDIDDFTAKAKDALAAGNFAMAEKYANRAIGLSDQIKGGVTSDGRAIVSALQGQELAAGKVKEGYGILLEVNKQRVQAEKDGVEATKATAATARQELESLKTKLTEVQTKIADGVTIKVKNDEASLAAARKELDELTKDRTTINYIKNVREDSSGTPDTTFGGDPGERFARGGLVGAFMRASQPSRSPVGAAFAKRFARGGFAGKVPGTGDGDTVPATLQAGQFVLKQAASRHYGDGLLGALFGRRRFAGGGQVTKEQAEAWAKNLPLFGEKNPFGITIPDVTGANIPKMPDTYQNYGAAPINFDTRPIPEALLTAINVLTYAREMLNAVGANNPLLGSLKPAIEGGISAVERSPADRTALLNLLRAAETIGANPYIFAMWGKTTGAGDRTTPIWFVDWLADRGFDVASGGRGGGISIGDIADFAKRFFGAAASAAGAPNILTGGGKKAFTRRFAEGGDTDTVPAMLTPGEWVFQRPAVQHYGSRFMHALNNMMIPRAALANMLAPPVPVSRFAAGGPVGNVSGNFGVGRPGGEAPINVTFNLDASDMFNERMLRAKVLGPLNEIIKRSRTRSVD